MRRSRRVTPLQERRHRQARRGGHLQLDLFDERDLIGLTHIDYPGERLIACRNSALAWQRAEKRKDLIATTTREFDKVAATVAGGRLNGDGQDRPAGRPGSQ
jgi:hypothetical protein